MSTKARGRRKQSSHACQARVGPSRKGWSSASSRSQRARVGETACPRLRSYGACRDSTKCMAKCSPALRAAIKLQANFPLSCFGRTEYKQRIQAQAWALSYIPNRFFRLLSHTHWHTAKGNQTAHGAVAFPDWQETKHMRLLHCANEHACCVTRDKEIS